MLTKTAYGGDDTDTYPTEQYNSLITSGSNILNALSDDIRDTWSGLVCGRTKVAASAR